MRLRKIYREWLFPYVTRWCLSGRALERERQAALAGVSGEVLEVGFGSGLNLPFYPASVTRLIAVDCSQAALKMAAPRIVRAAFPVEVQMRSGEDLPLAGESVDSVVFTWTLCMIDDPMDALSEARRVLRPGGQLFFLEHGRSGDAAFARWQDRWNPLNRCLFAGCNINRPIDALVRAARFDITSMHRYQRRGPRLSSSVYSGVAVKAAACTPQ